MPVQDFRALLGKLRFSGNQYVCKKQFTGHLRLQLASIFDA
jgi:hypothetical protein